LIGHIIRHNEFAVNILEGAISGQKAVERPQLQYLQQITRNTAADSFTAVRRMACNNFRWKAANRSNDCSIRRRIIIRKTRRRRRRRRRKFTSCNSLFYSM
jgi:hypothetical protein